MKIFYAIQATGNGHISRALELMPFLKKFGTVDVFLSGNNSTLQMPFDVKYKSKGLSLFYGNNGNLNYLKMAKAFNPLRIIKEAKQLPVEQYDIVINDFESITSLACALKKVPNIHFGHQASFASPLTPRPAQKDFIGEVILNKYASSKNNIGLHFKPYDQFIFSPIIKSSILNAEPINKGHITVYLSHYSDAVVAKSLLNIKHTQFHVFSKTCKSIYSSNNITFYPVDNALFTKSLVECEGVITGAGFETPAETMYLGKRLLCLPILGQYEQLCNAEALKQFDVKIVTKINDGFHFEIKQWLNSLTPKPYVLNHTTEYIVETVIDKGLSLKNKNVEELDTHQIINPSLSGNVQWA